MQPTNNVHLRSDEAAIVLAIQAIDSGGISSVRKAALLFNVSRTTLKRRMDGIRARRDCVPNSSILTKLEEEAIVRYIIDLDSRGFSPSLDEVRDMADTLLKARDASPVGQNWPSTFVRRTRELKTRLNRRRDYQRQKCEDPAIIKPWFVLVKNTIEKYGIVDDDIYNFDETGFLMGVIRSSLVVTVTERRSRPNNAQPGNREWSTQIHSVSAAGVALPPFFILKAQCHLTSWFTSELPPDSVIAVSDNGWTTNEIGVSWIKHFDLHTRGTTKGTHRLLILDGHESHHSAEFETFCKQNNIVTLCMPPHSSHILQPLDVACFGPLKVAYKRQIEGLMRNRVTHIDKESFLPAASNAFRSAFTKSNIKSGFRATGLVPFEPNAVLSKLDIRPATSSPSPSITSGWESRTPLNHADLAAQSNLITGRINRHQNSSPTPITSAIEQFLRGAHNMAAKMTFLQDKCTQLERTNEMLSKRRRRKQKRLQTGGTITASDGQDMVAQLELNAQIEAETRAGRRNADGSIRQRRRCGTCGETGHNSRTCTNERDSD